ncbi:MAG: LysM domain-containing protein [Oscillatoriophycideae cyanobacterium NC_groundwater_1537_Pr4_S-0.65um_50_18]|nr:LysM domain-containing protein [Oscillatoriophycideae cyanobacterium NC_groundwater_1537_Pr4_S-0.65um_50_18]
MNPFPVTSRYYAIEIAQLNLAGDRPIAYLRRRLISPPERFALLQEHQVVEGDRLDNIAAQYLGDPEQFWRICDANAAIRPQELEEVSRRLRITLPEGIPGVPYA